MSEGFFSRWSRRKREAGQADIGADGLVAGQSVPSTGDGSPRFARDDAPRFARDDVPKSTSDDTTLGHGEAAGHGHPDSEPAPLPTLEDVERLTPQSDFQPFMQRGVGTEVRNAAMKKLFADPHFNVMDGLDIYIDDYSQPDPMPAGMLRQMASAQFLKLVPEEAPARQGEPAPELQVNPFAADGMEVVAQSPDSSATADTEPHDHPDMQLQPDPAPADPQPGPGAR